MEREHEGSGGVEGEGAFGGAQGLWEVEVCGDEKGGGRGGRGGLRGGVWTWEDGAVLAGLFAFELLGLGIWIRGRMGLLIVCPFLCNFGYWTFGG